MPASWPSICIPRAFSNISEKRVAKVFELLELGTLDHIDMVERVDTNGKKFQRIFVHFTRWSSSPEASAVRTRLLEGKEVKIVYEDPWFWKISVNKAKPSGAKAGGGVPGARKKHVKPTINFGGDDSLQERKQEKCAEQRVATTPPGTPPGSPRKKEEDEEEKEEEEKMVMKMPAKRVRKIKKADEKEKENEKEKKEDGEV